MEVELRHLRAFATIAEELHFGRAAKRLHVAQPGLSQQIRRLERELGVELLDRKSRPIGLTAAGAAFLSEARLVLHHAERAVESGRRAARGELGTVSVGSTFWAYAALVPAAAREFRRRAPDVSLEITTAPPTVQVDWIHEERLDVCFLAFATWLTGRSRVRIEPVLTEPMMAIVADDHPLARRRRVRLEELAREPFVAVSHAVLPGLVDRQMAVFHERGLFPQRAQEVDDPLGLFSVIGAGVGVGLHMASLRNLGPAGVTFVAVADAPTATLLMASRRDDERPHVQTFLATAREVARALEARAA